MDRRVVAFPFTRATHFEGSRVFGAHCQPAGHHDKGIVTTSREPESAMRVPLGIKELKQEKNPECRLGCPSAEIRTAPPSLNSPLFPPPPPSESGHAVVKEPPTFPSQGLPSALVQWTAQENVQDTGLQTMDQNAKTKRPGRLRERSSSLKLLFTTGTAPSPKSDECPGIGLQVGFGNSLPWIGQNGLKLLLTTLKRTHLRPKRVVGGGPSKLSAQYSGCVLGHSTLLNT